MLVGDQAYIALKPIGSAGSARARVTENTATRHLRARIDLTPDEQNVLYWEDVATAPESHPDESQRPKRKLSGAAFVRYMVKRTGYNLEQLVCLRKSAQAVLYNQASAETA